MRIVSLEARTWTLPLRAPFAIATRVAYEAENILITLQTEDESVCSFGASAPVPYVTGETVPSVIAAIESVAHEFIGQPIERLGPLLSKANQALTEAPSALAGLEMAIYDAWGKYWKLPLWQFFGGTQTVLVNDLTIPLVSPADASVLAQQAALEGYAHLKIKVGSSSGHAEDLARIAAIVQATPEMRLRIDANQAFAPDAAIQFINEVLATKANIDLVEQPVAKEDIAGLKFVKEHVSIPIYADEAARSVASVIKLLQEDAVDGVNIKLMKSGISGALEIITLCQNYGKKLMLGCMLESSLGIAAAAQIAGGTGAFDFLDLDSHRLLAPIESLSGGFICTGETLQIDPTSENGGGWGINFAK
jgi:L-Ala-D/L-Glu epimerase